MFVVESTIRIEDGNKRLFATSAYEVLVERECPAAIVVEFADGNTDTLKAERKNTPFENHFGIVVIEIAEMWGLKMIEEMLFAQVKKCRSLEVDQS